MDLDHEGVAVAVEPMLRRPEKGVLRRVRDQSLPNLWSPDSPQSTCEAEAVPRHLIQIST